MRLLLSLVGLTLLSPALAQETNFNLHQAALDGMPIEEARPAIEAIYGPLRDLTKDLPPNFVSDAVTALATAADMPLSYFVFCDGKFATFTAIMSPAVARDILAPLTLSTAPRPDVFPEDDGVNLTFEEADLIAFYQGVGTKQSQVTIAYPRELMLTLDFAGYCAELAAK
ncbi:MAG: hypothetical protein ABW043_06400 [Devosia sp.]|uniref:hypothetical protein n=1 Tax=Devosia sp. TaxID=1871048 RepID=UPI00339613DF